jgi:hypothetical protein
LHDFDNYLAPTESSTFFVRLSFPEISGYTLAKTDPAAYQPDVALTLNNLAVLYSDALPIPSEYFLLPQHTPARENAGGRA